MASTRTKQQLQGERESEAASRADRCSRSPRPRSPSPTSSTPSSKQQGVRRDQVDAAPAGERQAASLDGRGRCHDARFKGGATERLPKLEANLPSAASMDPEVKQFLGVVGCAPSGERRRTPCATIASFGTGGGVAEAAFLAALARRASRPRAGRARARQEHAERRAREREAAAEHEAARHAVTRQKDEATCRRIAEQLVALAGRVVDFRPTAAPLMPPEVMRDWTALSSSRRACRAAAHLPLGAAAAAAAARTLLGLRTIRWRLGRWRFARRLRVAERKHNGLVVLGRKHHGLLGQQHSPSQRRKPQCRVVSLSSGTVRK